MDEKRVTDTEEGEIRAVYCPACDREVRIKVAADKEMPTSDEDEGASPTQLSGICLDVGEDCTGAFCPFGEQPEV